MVLSVLQETLRIAGIVFVLMVAVEFAEVRFGEQLRRWLGRSALRQCISASALGVVPGCITAFFVTSLYEVGLECFHCWPTLRGTLRT